MAYPVTLPISHATVLQLNFENYFLGHFGDFWTLWGSTGIGHCHWKLWTHWGFTASGTQAHG